MQQPQPDKAKSDAARAEGNTAFKKGKWVDSIGHYTNAIVHNPADPVAYGNRAQAFLKLDKYADAERDCTSALERQKDNIKALYRRALARRGLDNLVGAESDLWHLLKIDPANKTAQEELEEVRALIKEAEKVKASKPKRPISPPKLQSSDAREVNRADRRAADSPKPAQPASPTAVPLKLPVNNSSASNGFAALRQKRDARPAHVAKAPASSPSPVASPVSTAAQPIVAAESSTSVSNTLASTTLASASASTVTPPTEAKELKPPTDPTSKAPGTGLLLLRALSSLSPANGWTIMRQYPSSNVPLILGPVLEPDTLAIVIRVLDRGHKTDAAAVASIMTGLQTAPRIRMNAAMLDEPDRATATRLWSSHSTTKWP